MRAIVIGAGAAGLASAACLKDLGVEVAILERAEQVAARWRGHYDRLVLHTSKGRSALPGLPMPKDWPRYVSRDQLIEYLESYRIARDLWPQFGVEVQRVARAGDGWRLETSRGEVAADIVVVATGLAQLPHRPEVAGLETFPGTVLHSSEYRNPETIPGQRVLVVGFGNSGGDVALDLAEAGRKVDLVVRGPVNILPKELLGIPIASFELLTRLLPYRWADTLTAPLLRAFIGRPEAYGLTSSEKGPAAQVIEDGRIPMIDVGALSAIREGRIGVRPGMSHVEGERVHFTDGAWSGYDTMVLATGYRVDLRPLLPDHPEVLDAGGHPTSCGGQAVVPGLYFCSYVVSANGQLRQMSREARAIAADVARLMRERA